MALHGLDRAGAPEADKAKAMLNEIRGSWWNVYVGGPRSGGSGWTPDQLRRYTAHGITRFLLTYVGRQQGDVHLLTRSQGEEDGNEARQIAARLGYSATGTPICLDLEGRTYDASPQGSLDYMCGWCHAVRAHGLRPGVYSNPRALIPLETRSDRPDWVWAASWVTHKVDPQADPHRIPGLSNNLWSKTGQRAWQYAGAFGKQACKVGGLDVDISVADEGCLAGGEHLAAETGGEHLPAETDHTQAGTYTVRAGDTLSGIAAQLQIAGGWPALYELNRSVIGPDPNLILPGQVLQLP
jgi:hypothetical protein